ncbi:Pol polyprotein [Plakobranchus ocellatus]|uniref:Pol polyprotein n=1 Tax=Plakobranchus ocellatus TaxID=259542 RepID=A0AAV4CY69_9GAST|nr:Pol polyprotein [Plakobranchus ocellatus]
MSFGIISAQEVFHKRIHEAFEDIEGVETDIDDILVWGKNTKKHDERLRKILNRYRKINLTLSEKKCHFDKEEITYLGHKLTQDGVQPDKDKVKAITAIPPPEDKKGVERLLGTVNYMTKFTPNLSKISEPIRKLLKKDSQFVWEHEQAKSFEEIKNALTSEKTLGYFNPNEKITLECDSSQFGLGAVMTQRGKPIRLCIQIQTPNITGLKYSPAQLLLNRRLCDNIPTLKINLKPAIPAKARQELEARQQKQKVFFDRHVKPYK